MREPSWPRDGSPPADRRLWHRRIGAAVAAVLMLAIIASAFVAVL